MNNKHIPSEKQKQSYRGWGNKVMDYKEMIKLRALELELDKQRKAVCKKLDKYLQQGKSVYNIEYETLCIIRNFYEDSINELNKK